MHDLVSGSEMEKDLLVASIAVGADNQFAVTVIPTSLGKAQHHYVRFALHYYARVLYLLARGAHHRSDLPTLIDLLIRTTIDKESDLFLLAGLDGALVPKIGEPVAHAELVMKSAGAHECELVGNSSLEGWALSHSVIAVLQYLADRLSEESLATLTFGLENMNSSYSTVYRHADPASQAEVPRIAYHVASKPGATRAASRRRTASRPRSG
jgi:hypothetical protein